MTSLLALGGLGLVHPNEDGTVTFAGVSAPPWMAVDFATRILEAAGNTPKATADRIAARLHLDAMFAQAWPCVIRDMNMKRRLGRGMMFHTDARRAMVRLSDTVTALCVHRAGRAQGAALMQWRREPLLGGFCFDVVELDVRVSVAWSVRDAMVAPKRTRRPKPAPPMALTGGAA